MKTIMQEFKEIARAAENLKATMEGKVRCETCNNDVLEDDYIVVQGMCKGCYADAKEDEGYKWAEGRK